MINVEAQRILLGGKLKNFHFHYFTKLKQAQIKLTLRGCGWEILFCLLLISQQNILNKSCKEYFYACLLFLYFFVGLKLLGLWGKNLFFGVFAKAYFYSIHVRHFAYGQCIVYIVSNKRTRAFFKFLFLSFYIFVFKYKKKIKKSG